VFNEYIYPSTWKLSYSSVEENIHKPITMIVRAKTQEEIEEIVVEKISLFLGMSIHLKQDEEVGEDLYMVVDSSNIYRGMVEIQPEKTI